MDVVLTLPCCCIFPDCSTRSSPCFSSYLCVEIQVMKLGVLSVIAQKILALLKALCKGGLARYESVAKTIVAMNERIRNFGRLIMASLVSFGYGLSFFCCSFFARVLLPSWILHPEQVSF